jgi:hypothetical protein
MARVRRDASEMGRKTILPPIAHSLDGAKKLGLDWDKAEENLTVYHNYTKSQIIRTLRLFRNDLAQAEADGRRSKATKIRREINKLLEADLAIYHSTCPSCGLYSHRCRCTSDPTVSRSTNWRRKQKELKGLELLRWSQGWEEADIIAEQISKGRKY